MVLDIDIAPEAPEGFEPAADRPAPAPEPVVKPPPPEEPEETTLEPETAEVVRADAGPEVADAAPAVARVESDAGPVVDSDAGPTIARVDPDAGPGTVSVTPPREAAPPGPPGTAADFRPYVPAGDKVTVLLRYDRLRGTPWAKLADSILAPMPDYRAIVGNRGKPLAELFDVLLISSRNPADVTATNLIARVRLGSTEIRRFLDHKLQPVRWKVVRGGTLGRRLASPSKLERDSRVYLLPFPGWVVLTRSKHLGAPAQEAPAVAADLDHARADEAALPDWILRARTVENESGQGAGPIAVVSVSGIKRTEVELPQLGTIPVPVHAALAVELTKQGFYLRGTLTFSSAERAGEFQKTLEATRARLIGSTLGELALKNFHAYHALKGLSLRRRDAKVTYATSISPADGKAMMQLAADWARRFYAAQEEVDLPAEPAE
jgi:hypothetical protein